MYVSIPWTDYISPSFFFTFDMIRELLPDEVLKGIKSRFSKVFENYFRDQSIPDAYYYFYKNFHNFYNECRFTTGSYTGYYMIFPFNNLELIDLFNEFSFKETFSHKYHFMALYYNNPKLSSYKMGHFPLSVMYKPFFIYHIAEPFSRLDAS